MKMDCVSVPRANERSTFLVVGGRIIVMKIFFTIIGSFLFLFSNFVYANSNKKTTLTGLSENEAAEENCQLNKNKFLAIIMFG
tara:strand:+ start:129 stop:377 length:249 start_codon:yes stop_codon:yes gene_type:complete